MTLRLTLRELREPWTREGATAGVGNLTLSSWCHRRPQATKQSKAPKGQAIEALPPLVRKLLSNVLSAFVHPFILCSLRFHCSKPVYQRAR